MEHIRRLIQEKEKSRFPRKYRPDSVNSRVKIKIWGNRKTGKNKNFENLVEQNIKIREAIARMERVAMDNYYDELRLSPYSDQEEINKKK